MPSMSPSIYLGRVLPDRKHTLKTTPPRSSTLYQVLQTCYGIKKSSRLRPISFKPVTKSRRSLVVGSLTLKLYSVIARKQIDVAKHEGCIAVSHGCTGSHLDFDLEGIMLIMMLDREGEWYVLKDSKHPCLNQILGRYSLK